MKSSPLLTQIPVVRVASVLLDLAAAMLLVMCLTEQPAKAYADPGSGAVLWQLFFASVVSIGFHFRKLRIWISRRWPRRRDPAS